MKDLLDKLSSYNLFNYLLPGAIFVVGARRVSTHRFEGGDIVTDLFLYYFLGMVISRIGSIAIEPALKKLRIVHFAPREDFIRACQRLPKIEVLSEQNNAYRTLCAVFPALGVLKLYDMAAAVKPRTAGALVVVALCALFVAAYRKQTRYIAESVKVALS